jgi:hypothetical protein
LKEHKKTGSKLATASAKVAIKDQIKKKKEKRLEGEKKQKEEEALK